MGVGQDDGINAARLKGKALVLYPVQGISALAHAAVQQHPTDGRGFQQMAGAGDFLCRAVKCNGSHELSLCRRRVSAAR